jgi:hypothetical protein
MLIEARQPALPAYGLLTGVARAQRRTGGTGNRGRLLGHVPVSD